MSLHCPACQSENTQRFAMVYQQGLSDLNATAIGAGLGSGGAAAGASKISGVFQSSLSRRVAPPEKKRYLKPLGWIFLVFVIASFFVKAKPMIIALDLVWLAASAVWIGVAFNYNANSWTRLQSAWINSFICIRCGHTFRSNN